MSAPDGPAPPHALPGDAGVLKPPRVGCRAQHARRLLIASGVFAVSLLTTLALVTAFIVQDLSEQRVNRILSQAREEAEAVARFVNDPGTMGEGETVDTVRGGSEREFDAPALLGQLAPRLYDERGMELSPLEGSPIFGQGFVPEVSGGGSSAPRIPAFLSSRGQELLTLVNGELVEREALQFIEIKSPGGKQILTFHRLDMRDWDRSIADDPGTLIEKQGRVFRPSTRRITMEWDSVIDGQPVTLQAGIDASVIQEGVAELRRRTIPKVIAGAAAFLVLLGIAYLYVFRLLGEARRLDAEASEQALLAQVGMLAAGLAHEIRNPLSAVQMNLQLLEEDLLEDARANANAAAATAAATATATAATTAAAVTASARPCGATEHVSLLQATQKEIRRLGSLVSDFLTYARPMTPRPAPVRIDALVRDCVALFSANASGLGVTLDVDLQAGDDALPLDDAMTKQALMNVLKNAIEAVPQPGGRVVISTRRSADVVQVRVTDDGPGVPADPEQMFRVFHSTKKGGTGLGLPISRALAVRQGGSLTAQAGPQGGAMFVLSLPARAPAGLAAPIDAGVHA